MAGKRQFDAPLLLVKNLFHLNFKITVTAGKGTKANRTVVTTRKNKLLRRYGYIPSCINEDLTQFNITFS